MKKQYTIIYKFSDVIDNIEANSKEQARKKAQELLEGDYNPQNDTSCYEIEIEEVKVK